MKLVRLYFSIVVLLASIGFVEYSLSAENSGQRNKSAKIKKTKISKNLTKAQDNSKLGNLSTSIAFDGSDVNGKYQQSADGTATVEDDKYLSDLLSAPSNFKDRMEAEKSRY